MFIDGVAFNTYTNFATNHQIFVKMKEKLRLKSDYTDLLEFTERNWYNSS